MSISNASSQPIRDSSAADDLARLSERLRVVVLALIMASTILAPIAWWTRNAQTLWTCAAGLAVGGACHLLRRLGRVDAAVFFLLFAMLSTVTTSMILGEGVHDSGMILYPTVIVVGSLLLRPATYRLLVVLVVAAVSVVWWLCWTDRIAREFTSITDITDLVAIVTVLAVQAIGVNLLSRGLFRSLKAARRENVEWRAAEEEIRRLNAELERRVEIRTAELAAANENLETFSYSVSHDLRAPLRVASSYASILEQDFAGSWDPSARRLLERILASNTRMNALIDGLLHFSRLGRGKLVREEVDMRALAQESIGVVTTGSTGRTVDWVLQELPQAWADPDLIEQVFTNLIGNAFKYTGRTAHARIEIGFDHELGSYFVKDNGVGFDMRHASRLFGVFERIHRDDEFEGTGIGLATAHRIVTRHGGRIWANSKPGEGATFHFVLPPPDNTPAP